MKSEPLYQHTVHSLYLLTSHAVPNPPTLTVTPMYDSSGGLLEIESQARVGVSPSYLMIMQLHFSACFLQFVPRH